MKQHGIVRLALVLALLVAAVMTLLSRPDPDVPFAAWLFLNWLLDAALAFVILWVVLNLIAWAIRGLRK